jgi:hypothetical protein
MSISLKQLTAMVDIAEALAAEMKELIALRETIARQSVQHSAVVTTKDDLPLGVNPPSGAVDCAASAKASLMP